MRGIPNLWKSVPILSVGLLILFSAIPVGAAGLSWTAYPTLSPPTVNGVIAAGEYDDALLPLSVNFDTPGSTPGKVVFGTVVDQADLSFVAYMMYDATNLYIAVDVTDDQIWDDSSPWHDDCVEIFVDGDEASNDVAVGWNEEGFQIMMDVGGGDADNGLTYNTDWFGAAAPGVGGYVVEFRIPLSSIDMTDGVGETNPSAGSSIGFSIAVDDDDDGGVREAIGWWDGVDNNSWQNEADWGVLNFQSPPPPPVPMLSHWGMIVLMALLVISGIWMLRKKRRIWGSHQGS